MPAPRLIGRVRGRPADEATRQVTIRVEGDDLLDRQGLMLAALVQVLRGCKLVDVLNADFGEEARMDLMVRGDPGVPIPDGHVHVEIREVPSAPLL